MIPTINIKATGLLSLEEAFKKLPEEMQLALSDSATLIGDHILNEEGIRRYPPAGPGNRPPYPFYKRGVGTQTSKNHNTNTSQKLGASMTSKGETGNKSWYVNSQVKSLGSMIVTIGTKVTYAPYVVGKQQSRVMEQIGWKKLSDVAKAKASSIAKILEAVLNDALQRAGLRKP